MHRMWMAKSQVAALLCGPLGNTIPSISPRWPQAPRRFAQVIHMAVHSNPGTSSPRVNPPVLCATARSVPEEAAFEHDRYEQLAVAMLVEQHRDLVAVVALHRAHTPALARDSRADGERDLGPRGLGVRRVVVAVPAGARA